MTETKTKYLAKNKPELNIFGTLNKDQINNLCPPYALRNDCKVGMWKVGDNNFKSKTLDIAILRTEHYYGKLGKGTATNWMQIFFIAAPLEKSIPQNIVCVTYVKTRSLSALGYKLIEIMENQDPSYGIFQTKFQEHKNDLGIYYSLIWDWRERSEEEKAQLQLMADFLASQPILEDTNLVDTMHEIGTDPEYLAEVKVIVEEQIKQRKLLASANGG